MLTRREFVRYGVLAGSGTAAALLAGCGGRQAPSAPGPGPGGDGYEVRSVVSRAAVDPALAPAGAQVARAFTADLYRRLARPDANVVCSPYSVAVALAMTRTGARGRTAAEMDRVLHAPALQRLNGALGAVDAALDKRSGSARRADGSAAKVELHVANSLWGQLGVGWRSAFLDALARSYGAGMRLVDYLGDPDGARARINGWTSAQTNGKIDKLIPPGTVTGSTRLVLVNALYLKAPWEYPFDKSGTEELPFTRADGSVVTVPTMTAEIREARYGRGDGWQAAELRYAGNQLAMTVILPDRGTLPRLENDLDGDRLAQILRSPAPVGGLELRLPKWTVRTQTSLNESLIALGMPTAFDLRAADFSGMTTQEKLSISDVVHEAFVAVDEAGTEAAAATAVVMTDSAAVSSQPMVVDRPFLFVIHDLPTATPLFIGHVTDPRA